MVRVVYNHTPVSLLPAGPFHFLLNEVSRCPGLVQIVPAPFLYAKLYMSVDPCHSLEIVNSTFDTRWCIMPLILPMVPSFTIISRGR